MLNNSFHSPKNKIKKKNHLSIKGNNIDFSRERTESGDLKKCLNDELIIFRVRVRIDKIYVSQTTTFLMRFHHGWVVGRVGINMPNSLDAVYFLRA